MNMHKNTRLTPHHRQAIWLAYTQGKESVTSLARRYQVSRVTIYRALKAARGRLLKPQTSTNNRFKQAKYGMKRLAKVERGIQEKLKRQAKRYNKSYPGELVHLDTKRLPLLKGQKVTDKRDYLFVAIDDFSRELYTAILPDKTAGSAAKFLTEQVIEPCPYLIECVYSDGRRVGVRSTLDELQALQARADAEQKLAEVRYGQIMAYLQLLDGAGELGREEQWRRLRERLY